MQVRESDVQAVWLQSQADVVGRELWEESAQRDRELWEWRDRYHAASEGLRLREAGLEEVQRARDTALRSLRLQEEKTHSLGAQRQEMQHSLDSLQDRVRGWGWGGTGSRVEGVGGGGVEGRVGRRGERWKGV